MKITELKPQQRRPERISVFLDRRYAFSLDRELVVKFGLQVGAEVDAAELQPIIRAAEQKKAMDAALNLLSFRGRSRKEITDRLQRRGFSPEVVAATVARLVELKLLDDTRFAAAIARDRLEIARKGKRQIYADLRRKGVPKPIIEKTLSEVGDEYGARDTPTGAKTFSWLRLRSFSPM